MGRKAWITLSGMLMVFTICVLALFRVKLDPVAVLTAGITAIGFMVGAFNGSNAAATFAHNARATSSKTLTVESTTTLPKEET